MPSSCASTTSAGSSMRRREVLGDLAGHVVALHASSPWGSCWSSPASPLRCCTRSATGSCRRWCCGCTLEALHVAVGDVVAGDLVGGQAAMIWSSTMSWISSTETVWPAVSHSSCTLSAANLDLALGQATRLRDLRVCRLDGVDDLVQIEACLQTRLPFDRSFIRSPLPSSSKTTFIQHNMLCFYLI